MKTCVIFLFLSLLPGESVFVYQLSSLSSCSDSVAESVLLYSLDQNEILFEDYPSGQPISRLPPFADPIDFPYLHDYALAARNACLEILKSVTNEVGSPPEPKVPPEFSIYTRHEVVPGVTNNFICFIKNFYPPHLTVKWCRNGVLVTEGIYISQYSLNYDGTFNLISILTSSPNDGDEYSCTVEHQALDSPQTRKWDQSAVPVPEPPSVTPTVMFAVGIAVGILGLAMGMFFVIKALCF